MTKIFLKSFFYPALLLCCAFVFAAETKSASQDWPAASPAAIAHWQSLRFGMFIHWGPVSLTGKEIGWSRGAQTPIEVYDNLYKQFNPTNFNADEWGCVWARFKTRGGYAESPVIALCRIQDALPCLSRLLNLTIDCHDAQPHIAAD